MRSRLVVFVGGVGAEIGFTACGFACSTLGNNNNVEHHNNNKKEQQQHLATTQCRVENAVGSGVMIV